MSNEARAWKTAVDDAVAEYIINPCLQTAAAMLEATHLFCPDAWTLHFGTCAAINEEVARAAAPHSFRAWRLRAVSRILQVFTWHAFQWDDYYALRWTFRREWRSVERMHRRCHLGGPAGLHARYATTALMQDADFLRFFVGAYGVGEECSWCQRKVWEARNKERAMVAGTPRDAA